MGEKNNQLTQGSIGKGLLQFAFPLFLGNLFQQLYNVADSLVVGNYCGKEAGGYSLAGVPLRTGKIKNTGKPEIGMELYLPESVFFGRVREGISFSKEIPSRKIYILRDVPGEGGRAGR